MRGKTALVSLFSWLSIFVAATLFVMATALFGARNPTPAPASMPANFGGWTASAPATQISGPQIGQIAGDKAAILQEYGTNSAERREYAQGPQSVTATLYRMVDPTAAFGAFTFLRDAQMAPIAAGNAAAYTGGTRDRALFVVGNLLIDITATPNAAPPNVPGRPAAKNAPSAVTRPSDEDLKTLAQSLLPRADRRPYPNIADYLPQNGLEHGSEHYVLGPQAMAQVFPLGGNIPPDWIGFDRSAEAMVARYHLKGQPKDRETILVLAMYPTQQIAADRYNQLTKWFALNTDPAQAPAEAGGRPQIFGTRSSVLVAVLSGVESQPVASGFLDQIHYASAVMWDEPSQTMTDPSIGTMVVGAFMGTGSIMILAIAAGIGFGGFRLLTKLILPGKVFDSDQRVEILQLGLSSKPIRVGDFYSTSKS